MTTTEDKNFGKAQFVYLHKFWQRIYEIFVVHCLRINYLLKELHRLYIKKVDNLINTNFICGCLSTTIYRTNIILLSLQKKL